MNLDAQLEALLFVAAEPLSIKKLAQFTSEEPATIHEALDRLRERLQESGSGLLLIAHEHAAELVTKPEAAELVKQLAKDQIQGELSRPSMEALTILTYRGPLTRPELEQVRGVQSSMILRNLMLRGLVEMTDELRLGQPVYRVTIDFLKFLGVERVEDLPNFQELHQHATVTQVLDQLQQSTPEEQKSTELHQPSTESDDSNT